MKRFAVFAFNQYYPSGGMKDFQKSFDTREEALEWALQNKESFDRWCVEDMEAYDA